MIAMMKYEFNTLDQLTRHIICHDLLIVPASLLSARICAERKRITNVFRKLKKDADSAALLPGYAQQHYECINTTISLLQQSSGNIYGAMMHDGLCRLKQELEDCFAAYLKPEAISLHSHLAI